MKSTLLLRPSGEVVAHGKEGAAFLSTPSIYFSLPKELRSKCKLFDVSASPPPPPLPLSLPARD